jgi:inosine-uridine nucleoside N-ribohydrolase
LGGVLAQLVERLNGIEEVRGSNPLGSKSCIVFAAIFWLTARFAGGETVWIDTDVAIGSPIREVDDAYALVLAFHSPELRIAGISTSYGNATLARTSRVAREMAERFGPSGVHVFEGAKSPADRGRGTEASDALAETLTRQSVTYIALGPLTNLASFVELHPELRRRIRRVIFVGGQVEDGMLTLGPRRSFHIHDANVFKDPRAAVIVLASGMPITLAPISTGRNLMITPNDLRDLGRAGGAAEYLARRSKVWLWFWTRVVGTRGGAIFDALAIAAATDPALLSTEQGSAQMDKAGNMIVTPRPKTGGRRVIVCRDFAPNLKDVVLERLRNQ